MEPYVGIIDEIKSCTCVNPINAFSTLNWLEAHINEIINPNNATCLINTIFKCCNNITVMNLTYQDPIRLAFTDLFYRIRHELLFKSTMVYLGLDQTKSDTPFNSFGIESNRTPDYIGYHSDYLVIMEITATSKFEKGAQQKGLESAGFESKYKREIDSLIKLGKKVFYTPIIFEMSTTTCEEYKPALYELNSIINLGKKDTNKNLLDYVAKEFKILTLNLKDNLTAPSSILFSKNITINSDHKNLEFLYVEENSNRDMKYPKYFEQKIATKVYMKVINSMDSLGFKIRRLSETENYLLVVDMITNRVLFETFKNGLKPNEWGDLIDNGMKRDIFNHTMIKLGNDYKKCTESETGYTYIIKQERSSFDSKKQQQVELIAVNTKGHSFENYIDSEFNFDKYVELSQNYKEKVLVPKYFRYTYEDEYFKFIENLDGFCADKNEINYSFNEKPEFLGENKLRDYNINEIMDNVINIYTCANKIDSSLPLKKKKVKPPFILPFAEVNQTNYTSHMFKNITFLNKVKDIISDSNPFTSLILSKCLDSSYKFGEEGKQPSEYLNELIREKSKACSEMTSVYKTILKKQNLNTGIKSNTLKDYEMIDCPEKNEYIGIKEKVKTLSKTVEQQYKIEKIKRNISMIRLKTKRVKKTKETPHISEDYLTGLYKKEMEHFKDRTTQSTIEGVGIIDNIENDYKQGFKSFNEIIDLLSLYCGHNPDNIIDMMSYDDCKLLKDCKAQTIELYKELMDQIKNSYLGHSAALVSRMAHSLLFYSQLPFNSDYIRIDNLGYKDVLLMVKGGKKIFKTKSSKLYRMLYPISPCVAKLYVRNHVGPSSFELINIDGSQYILTPWMLLHESILNDALSFYSRITSFVALNSDPSLNYSDQSSKTALNVLLAFHNRRQTETLLANIRYILLSTIGEYSAFSEILKEFVGFNYDFFQAFIRNSIVINYPKYFKEICNMDLKSKSNQLNVTNIFTRKHMDNTDEIALMIYSTFLMTKAPYQRAIERANNLKGILEIHEGYKTKIGLKLTASEQIEKLKVDVSEGTETYINKLFLNEYNLDPNFITQIGIFADSYFLNRNLKEQIFIKWNRILNENWDSLATSTGLRSRLSDKENFWGKKGYFVVYKEIKSDMSYMMKVDKMINDETMDFDMKRRQLRELNQTFFDKIKNPAELLTFHAVDKTQWRGGREIYVMDIDTKADQQPIEKFMGELCRMLDNELISIPSDKRAQTIHHVIFEKDLPLKDTLTYYLTLDCSKWAPKSIFIKFALMIIPMSVVPYSFKVHFLNYLSKLYFKRIYFNISEVEVLRNNPKFKLAIDDNLIYDDSVKGYYLNMPYSWVMGIFNYTSSFLHALNQKYMSYIITQSSINKYNEETTLVMFAHSDDSGGRISASREFLIQRGLVIYEIGLKACNHLLSRKKCTVSLVYFEILSIIYIFKQLLALLPKFLGGIRFLPTDKGMAQDMLQSYSKSIEVMVAGGDFTIAYLVMKIHSYLVWKFYMSTPPQIIDYERPVQYLGMPDSHPMIVLLSGSDSDIIRILYIKGETYLSKLCSFVQNIFETFNEEGTIRSLKFLIHIKGAVKGFESELIQYKNLLNNWTIKNVNFRTTPFAFLNFLSKLNDPGFVGSLLNESPIRRISRSYYLRIGQSVVTKYGNKTLKFAYESITSFQLFLKNDIALKTILDECIPEDDQNIFNKEIEDGAVKCISNLKVLKVSCFNIFKIYEYFNQITLEGKKMLNTNRTLKPTHLEIVKTSKPFSVDFSPSQLVSYCKNPEFRWALPDISNLLTAEIELRKLLEIHDIDFDEVDESTLMKLLGMFSGKSVKDIYLYSHVPSEIRTMRTYSSLLSFLSVNTLKGKEIMGLVLKLSSDLTDPGYLPLQIDEDIYIINTFLVSLIVLGKLLGWGFIEKIKLKSSKILKMNEVKVNSCMEEITKNLNENYMLPYLLPTINYIKNKSNWPNRSPTGSIFDKGAYYTFTKSQKTGHGWYGKGEIVINVEHVFFRFELLNDSLVKCFTNYTGKVDKITHDFMIDVLTSNNIYVDQRDMKDISLITTEYGFGFDHSGDLKIGLKREIKKGIDCVFQTALIGDLAHLEHFYVEHKEDNLYLLTRRGDNNSFGSLKIRTAKILKGELLNTMKSFYEEEPFQKRMIETGIEDFEDFLLTEVLTEFGGENYIDFTTFVDNFQSSRVYEIMVWGQENNLLPSKNKYFGDYPGTEGGLVDIFLKYGQSENKWVIKPPNKINRAIMNLRSEYPESFSVILEEKISEFYSEIYNVEEKQEIRKAYMNLITSTDQSQVRKNLINLMCYWGYSSLVNTIQCFSSLKVDSNYQIFKITGYTLKEQSIYSNLFEDFTSKLNSVIVNYTHLSKNLNYKFPRLSQSKNGIEEIVINYVKGIVNSLYGCKTILTNQELYSIKMLVILDALFELPEFTNDLEETMSDLYPISLLPISIENKNDFIVMMNTLKSIWSKTKAIDYSLNYTIMTERFPNNIENPYSIQKKILGNLISPAETYFHGYLNREYINKMKDEINFCYKGIEYKIKNSISTYSDIAVPLIEGLSYDLPLNEETLNSPQWEDIVYETEMVEIDYDTIYEYWEELEDKYIEQESIIEDNYVEMEVKWIVDLCCENKIIYNKFIRQVGECICLVTTSRIDGFLQLPNSHLRVVNINTMGKYTSEFYVYITMPVGVKEDFVNKFIGPNKPFTSTQIEDELLYNQVRTPEGVCKSTNMGVSFSDAFGVQNNEEDSILPEDTSSSDTMLWGTLNVNDQNLQSYYQMKKNNEIKSEVRSIVDEALTQNPQCKNMYENLYIKYCKNIDKNLRLTDEMLMASLIAELDLNELNQNFKKNIGNILTKDEVTKIFVSPTHFGLAHSKTNKRPVNYKDKKVKAELESLDQTLADKVASGTLTISPKYRKIMESNLKIWKNYIISTSHKQESKKFLWNLLRSLCLDSTPIIGSDDDHLWKEITEKCVNYIADDGTENKDLNESFKMTLKQGARLKYRHKGN